MLTKCFIHADTEKYKKIEIIFNVLDVIEPLKLF